jgi:hypothetical protein
LNIGELAFRNKGATLYGSVEEVTGKSDATSTVFGYSRNVKEVMLMLVPSGILSGLKSKPDAVDTIVVDIVKSRPDLAVRIAPELASLGLFLWTLRCLMLILCFPNFVSRIHSFAHLNTDLDQDILLYMLLRMKLILY